MSIFFGVPRVVSHAASGKTRVFRVEPDDVDCEKPIPHEPGADWLLRMRVKEEGVPDIKSELPKVRQIRKDLQKLYSDEEIDRMFVLFDNVCTIKPYESPAPIQGEGLLSRYMGETLQSFIEKSDKVVSDFEEINSYGEKHLPFDIALSFDIQILERIRALYNAGWEYKDYHFENILVDEHKNLRFIDFEDAERLTIPKPTERSIFHDKIYNLNRVGGLNSCYKFLFNNTIWTKINNSSTFEEVIKLLKDTQVRVKAYIIETPTKTPPQKRR